GGLCGGGGGGGRARGDRGRHADRAGGARRLWRTRGRERGAAAPWRAAVLGVLGAVAGGARGGELSRRLRHRARDLAAAAQGVAPAVHAGAQDPRGRRRPAWGARARAPRVRGASRSRVLAAQRRARARGAEEGEEPAAWAGLGAAPPAADRGGGSPPRGRGARARGGPGPRT